MLSLDLKSQHEFQEIKPLANLVGFPSSYKMWREIWEPVLQMSIPSDLLNQPSRFSCLASKPSLRACLLSWVLLPLCIDSPRCHQWRGWESALYPHIAMAWVWCLMVYEHSSVMRKQDRNMPPSEQDFYMRCGDVRWLQTLGVTQSIKSGSENELSELHIKAKEEDPALKNVGLILSGMSQSLPKLFGICVYDYWGWMIVIKQLWLFMSLIPLSMSLHKEINVT